MLAQAHQTKCQHVFILLSISFGKSFDLPVGQLLLALFINNWNGEYFGMDDDWFFGASDPALPILDHPKVLAHKVGDHGLTVMVVSVSTHNRKITGA